MRIESEYVINGKRIVYANFTDEEIQLQNQKVNELSVAMESGNEALSAYYDKWNYPEECRKYVK